MPKAGRLGDKSQVPADSHGCPGCPHPAMGPAVSGSPNVKINSRPALRVDDVGVHAACCGSNTWKAAEGSATVFINGKPAHRVGDAAEHCGGTGRLVEGSPNVFIGGASSAGGGGGSGGGTGEGGSASGGSSAQGTSPSGRHGLRDSDSDSEEPGSSTGSAGDGSAASTARSGAGGKKKKKPTKATILSQTVATQPANQQRTRVGVGEDVKLTYSAGNATWSTTSGMLNSTSGSTVKLTAPDVAGTITVTAIGATGKATIRFTVVAPAGVRMRRIGGCRHRQDRPTSGMYAETYLYPDDVSFYNLRIQEVNVPCTATGAYAFWNGWGHDEKPRIVKMTDTVVPGLGTKDASIDDIYSGDVPREPPFGPGTITYRIPYQYRVGQKGSWHVFTTVEQQHILASDGKTLITKKADASVSCQVSDPTMSGK